MDWFLIILFSVIGYLLIGWILSIFAVLVCPSEYKTKISTTEVIEVITFLWLFLIIDYLFTLRRRIIIKV